MVAPRRLTCSLALLASLAFGAAHAADKPYQGPRPFNPADVNCPVGPTQLCIPLDNSFNTVPFGSNGGCSGPANQADPCRRNDDDSSVLINLPFAFNLYGTNYASVYINNNGNLSFDQPYCTYTPSGFPL